jgi:hypothetical protein
VLDPNTPDARVHPLEQSVGQLTTEITALKLELATLHSALRELQQQSGHGSSRRIAAVPPPVRPSSVPAAVVVLLGAGLLSWQLITTPRAPHPDQPVPVAHATQPPKAEAIAVETTATEPPVAPPVTPTVYRGTLAVKADRPGATVFVNGKNVGVAPVRVRNLRAGAHLVWVERDGYRRWTRVVTVPAEQITRVTADLEPITNND